MWKLSLWIIALPLSWPPSLLQEFSMELSWCTRTFLFYIGVYLYIHETSLRGSKCLTCLGLFTLASTVSRPLDKVLCVKCPLVSWVTCCILGLSRRWNLSHFGHCSFLRDFICTYCITCVAAKFPCASQVSFPSYFCTVSLLFEGFFLFPSVSVGNGTLRCP